MKRDVFSFFLIRFFVPILIIGTSYTSFSQCIPDTANCEDIGNPGEICPDTLPSGMQGVPYEEIITIISPDSAGIGDVSTPLVKVRLDTVLNMPPGIIYESEYGEFFPDSVYCISLSGTPTDTGTFYLGITVTPFIDILGNVVAMPAVVDDTSIFIRIEAPSLSELTNNNGFRVFAAFPNPYRESTQIGYSLSTPGEIELLVYNMLGRMVWQEKGKDLPGRNFFKFTGNMLPPGVYLYSVIHKDQIINNKLVKSR